MKPDRRQRIQGALEVIKKELEEEQAHLEKTSPAYRGVKDALEHAEDIGVVVGLLAAAT